VTPEQNKILWMVIKWLFLGAFLMVVIWSADLVVRYPHYLLLETRDDKYIIMRIDDYGTPGKNIKTFTYPRVK
jgi:hypothetical protein